MLKELSRFVVNNAREKFGLLLDFEQCGIVAKMFQHGWFCGY